LASTSAARPPVERGTTTSQQIDAGQRLRGKVAEQVGAAREVMDNGLQHAIMKQGGEGFLLVGRQLASPDLEPVGNAAFDALDGVQSAIDGNVGGFRRPGRDRPYTRCDEH